MAERIPVDWGKLSRAERERLEAMAQRVHDDFGRGEMHLMYRRDPKSSNRLGFIPIVTLPHCWHRDCVVNSSPPPPWPPDCSCVVVAGRDHSRDWRPGCPAHGRGSAWSWSGDVKERSA